MSQRPDLDDLLQRLSRAAETTDAEAPTVAASDQWERLHLQWDAEGIRARVDRALCPDPADRRLLEEAIAEAVGRVVAEREQQQRVLAEELGRELSRQVEDDLREPTAQLEERVRGLRERMQASRDRAARRRQR